MANTLVGPENLWLVEALHQEYRNNPEAVDASWRDFFAELDNGNSQAWGEGPHFAAQTLFRPPATPGKPGTQNASLEAARQSPQAAERLPFIKRVTLFRDLAEPVQRLVAGSMEEIQLKRDEPLFCAGDMSDGLYIVTRGRVRVLRDGNVVGHIVEGEIVAEMGLTEQKPRSADLLADTDVTALRLSPKVFNDLLRDNAELGRKLFYLAAARLRESNALQERVDQLIRSYRSRGHHIANLDPLGRRPSSHPELELAFHGLSEENLDTPFSAASIGGGTMTLRHILSKLQNTYCRTIGVQFMHIDDPRLKAWLQARMEATENHLKLSRGEQIRILTKLTDAEYFETFIQTKFLGARRFSLEGAESLIPLLDTAIEQSATQGVKQLVIGMAHRGRLNVLANIVGKNPQKIFTEFDDANPYAKHGRGDVKYHLGYSSDRQTSSGTNMHVSLCFNPSHLEFVSAVAMGRVRAKQERLQDAAHKEVLGIAIHGDAAFAGQGVVQEILNMSELPGYQTGGTVHIIVNNQVGFTTPPESARSSLYATDVARMLEIPIFHVNGEDPEGVAQVIRLALDFRVAFQRDVIIDMYCYRRRGHNEGDEPSFTQPVMYQWIGKQPTVRQAYLENLVKLGGITHDEADEIAVRCRNRLEEELARSKRGDKSTTGDEDKGVWAKYTGGPEANSPEVNTATPKAVLVNLLQLQAQVPADFTPHPKIVKLLETRRDMAADKKSLDWGTAEALAFATLLVEGTRVRLSGQDSGRGTFSHRHAVFHDFETGRVHLPLRHLQAGQAEFQVWDSPLSEVGVLGFDYGYSLDSPDSLVMWEAQYGDFVNGAQVIIDQFIAGSEQKWQRLSGLVMILPHGFEGSGAEHSSARLERFLSLAAEDNLQVVYPTTPAQIFHLLRRQVMRSWRKPLVIFSPKSLLRLPAAVSSLDELATGQFQRVIPDVEKLDLSAVRRVVLCSGKVYYDLMAARQEWGITDVALIRVEQLYPGVLEALTAPLAPYRAGTPVVWVQEEPLNMGAWPSLLLNVGHKLLDRFPFSCVAREAAAVPACGSARRHKLEQDALLEQALRIPKS